MTEQEKQEIRERSESVHETWWIDHPGTVAKLLCHDIPRLLDALDEREQMVKSVKEHRDEWRDKHEELEKETKRFRKALERIVDITTIPINGQYEVNLIARQALAGEEKG